MRKMILTSVFLLALGMPAPTALAQSDAADNRSVDKKEPNLTYTVKPGDTLYNIALAHDISLKSLMEWNGITGELIHPDDQLNVSIETPGSYTNLQKAKQTAAAAVKKQQAVVQPSASETAQTAVQPAEKPAESAKTASVPVTAPSGRELTMTATAYTAYCTGCTGTTRTGIDLRANPNQKVIAVDPSIIPLGSRVWVEGYGEAIAGDTGGAIKGNKIDVFLPGQDSAVAWGVKTVKVKVME